MVSDTGRDCWHQDGGKQGQLNRRLLANGSWRGLGRWCEPGVRCAELIRQQVLGGLQ